MTAFNSRFPEFLKILQYESLRPIQADGPVKHVLRRKFKVSNVFISNPIKYKSNLNNLSRQL